MMWWPSATMLYYTVAWSEVRWHRLSCVYYVTSDLLSRRSLLGEGRSQHVNSVVASEAGL